MQMSVNHKPSEAFSSELRGHPIKVRWFLPAGKTEGVFGFGAKITVKPLKQKLRVKNLSQPSFLFRGPGGKWTKGNLKSLLFPLSEPDS